MYVILNYIWGKPTMLEASAVYQNIIQSQEIPFAPIIMFLLIHIKYYEAFQQCTHSNSKSYENL